MFLRTAIALATSLCLVVTIAACRQPPRDDSPPRSSPEAQPARDSDPNWTIAWSQLKPGMDAVQVLSLLDEPRHVRVTKTSTTWYYSDRRPDGPQVVFGTREMRVERWRTPHRR